MPFAPTNLVATAVSSSSIYLSWNNDDDYPNGISVQRALYGHTPETIATVLYPADSYVDTGLVESTEYTYRVSPLGVDEFGNPYTASDSVHVYTYPGAITGLTAVTVADTATVKLSWTNNGSYGYVRVYYKLASEPTTWSYVDVTFRSTYTVAGLAENAEYDFQVASYEPAAGLFGIVSNTASDRTDIRPPTGLALAAITNTSIRLTWADNSSVEDGYEIYQDDVLVETTLADVETWDATGLTTGQEYEFYVRAKDGATCSSPTDTESLTAGVPPGAPAGLSATTIDHDRVALAWTNADTVETGIEVYRSEDGVTYSLVHTTAALVEAYNVSGLDADTLYYFRVRAVNASGKSAFSDPDSATTDTHIVAPTGLVLTAVSDTQVLVEYENESETVDYHEIWRRLDGGLYGSDPVGVSADEDYLDGTLSADRKYYYKVRDNYDGVTGPFCDEASVTTKSGGTEPVRRSETYFGMGNELCLQVDNIQGVRDIDSQYISKTLDFTDQDVEAHNRIKDVTLVVLEYEDKSADLPVTIGLSTDDGETYTEVSRYIGAGDGTQKYAEFRFPPISSKYFKLRIRSNDDSTDFSWTAVYVYYTMGGPSFEVE